MPLFISDDEFYLLSNDASEVAKRADNFISDLRRQVDVIRAEADAKAIADEQNCALLEQRHSAMHSEFSKLRLENARLCASTEKSISELADAQAEKHQLNIKAIAKDGEIERLSLEVAELHISKRQLLALVEQKDAEIRERNATIQSYVDKIVYLSENNASKESKINEIDAELIRCHGACTRLTQEKELVEKQNIWLDEELTRKASSLFELRRTQMDVEADMSGKIADLDRQLKEYTVSLNHSKERVVELEQRIKTLEEDLCLSKDTAAVNEENLNAELLTVNKLVDLYKESSKEWSKKAGELEGVIKALETHLSQIENDYKEKLEKESSLRKEFEKEATDMKIKLEKCDSELENTRKANELNIFALPIVPADACEQEPLVCEAGSDASRMLVPRIAAGVSGTALAASLLRDGWSLTKMYEKYQEASDALRHEKWGRKHAEAVLGRVLHEIEEKAEMIMEERVEHDRMIQAYALMNEKLQQALVEHDSYENTSRKYKAELRRQERQCSIAQKEINDLQKQVTVLLKECQDIQIRCGGPWMPAEDSMAITSADNGDLINMEPDISVHHRSFKNIHDLVHQNVKLRTLVNRLSTDEEKKDTELKDKFQFELQRVADEASSKVEIILKRSEEQASMIESLHSSVAMYRRLYEEEHKFRTSSDVSAKVVTEDGKKELMALFEGTQEVSKKAYEQLSSRAKNLEEDVARLSTELTSARAERDKMSLEAKFSKDRLDSFLKEFDHQRMESNAVSSRNMELTNLLIDYQKKLRESSSSLQAVEENSRKLSMEASVLKHERDILLSSEKRTFEEVQTLMERVHRLQSSLDTIQSTDEFRENVRSTEKRKQDDHIKRLEKDWAEAKRELQEERDRVRILTLDKERALQASINQGEEIRKELANAWHSVTSAESRAAVAEARCCDLETKIKGFGKQVNTEVGFHEQIEPSTDEVSEDLWKAKKELEKINDEACANKEYMLQYKEMALTNEAALKQMEMAHESYKSETVKMKKILEDEVQLLRNEVSEIERNYMFKCEEAATATESKEQALSSAMVETSRLREEMAENISKVRELQIQVFSLKADLDEEHKRWRISQDNYERQVILQSEAIQELTKTSTELSVKQKEVSSLQGLLDAQKTENDLLKLSWESEKSELHQAKSEAEKKCNEMDEQNRILHNRLEALHVKLAEKEQNSTGLPSGSSTQGDGDFQTVISYLRRSKEIAETELTLLRQEKMRLQSKVDGAFKASESAQALLHSQLENYRELLLKDDEFKSLQLQVREINLLRESNVQLREENKHNFKECQKYHEEVQKAKTEAEALEKLLKQKQFEVDDLRNNSELLKVEISNLNCRNTEILESCKNINVNEFEQMKDEFEQIKASLGKERESIVKLEQELTICRDELSEKEKRLNDTQNSDENFIQEIEKQKKNILALKSKNQSMLKEKVELNSKNHSLTKEIENLKTANQATMKEKEELSSRNEALAKEKDEISTKTQTYTKERDDFSSKVHVLTKEKEELHFKNQALLKQFEDIKTGKRVFSESEQAKKDQEKDTRIQILEKTLERMKEEHRNEKHTRKKTEMTIVDISNRINADKQKLEEEIQNHKNAISDLLQKSGILSSQLPPGSALDERTVAYFLSSSSYDTLVSSVLNDVEGSPCPPTAASNIDIPATSGQKIPMQQTKLPPRPISKLTEEKEKVSNVSKTNVEVRKPGRRIVRPNLENPEEPAADTETAGSEISSISEGKPAIGDFSVSLPAMPRKRHTPSEPEIPEVSTTHEESNIVTLPPFKRPKESENFEIPKCSDTLQSSENSDSAALQGLSLLTEVLEHNKLPSASNEGCVSMEKEDSISANEESEDQQKEYQDGTNANEVQYEADADMDLSDRLRSPTVEGAVDQGLKNKELKDFLFAAIEDEEDKEEGELMPEETEQQQDDNVYEGRHGFNIAEETSSLDVTEDISDIMSPSNDKCTYDPVEDISDDSEKHISSLIDQAMLGSEQNPETLGGVPEGSSVSSVQNLALGQVTPNEAIESQTRGSRTISISETAKRNAQVRQARMALQQQEEQQQQQLKPPTRGRLPPFRRDNSRGRGRGGRG